MDIVENLRGLSRGDNSDFSLGDEAAEEITRLRERVEKLESRLEITHVWGSLGERIEIAPENRDRFPDGIACRDETIKGLDALVKRLRERVADLEEK